MNGINARLNRIKKITSFVSGLSAEDFKILNYIVQNKSVEIAGSKKVAKKHKTKKVHYHCDKITDNMVRKVIELRANGVSFKEASKISGVKLGTINTAYFRNRVETLLAKIPSSNKIATN